MKRIIELELEQVTNKTLYTDRLSADAGNSPGYSELAGDSSSDGESSQSVEI